MRLPRVRITAGGLLVAMALAALPVGCGGPTGRELLQAKAKQLRPDMTVAEVDAVMRGHPRKEHRSGCSEGMPSGFGDALTKRPGVLLIGYDDRPGADEGDYVLQAYFDKDGKLVAIRIVEYWN